MKDKLFSLQNLWRRLKGESPSFFRKVRALCVTLAAAGGAMQAYVAMNPTAVFPPFVATVTGYLLACGLVGAVISSFTVSDNSQAVKP